MIYVTVNEWKNKKYLAALNSWNFRRSTRSKLNFQQLSMSLRIKIVFPINFYYVWVKSTGSRVILKILIHVYAAACNKNGSKFQTGCALTWMYIDYFTVISLRRLI